MPSPSCTAVEQMQRLSYLQCLGKRLLVGPQTVLVRHHRTQRTVITGLGLWCLTSGKHSRALAGQWLACRQKYQSTCSTNSSSTPYEISQYHLSCCVLFYKHYNSIHHPAALADICAGPPKAPPAARAGTLSEKRAASHPLT